MPLRARFPKRQEDFNKWLVSEYFKCGTVEAVFRKYRFNIPISYAQFQRILDKWGVVKSAGPNSKLTEAIEFLSSLAKENIPFERLYRRIPPSFQTSAATLYRILSYIKEGITRRVGVALVITPFNSKTRVLIARDVSTPRVELGKIYGALSLPMGYARKRDTARINILRILQNEVFTKDAINRSFPFEIISDFPHPFMYLDIADVRVSVYHIQLTRELSNLKKFSSYKLKDYSFIQVSDVVSGKVGTSKFRAGVVEILRGYAKYLGFLERNMVVNPLQSRSFLNKELSSVSVEIDL